MTVAELRRAAVTLDGAAEVLVYIDRPASIEEVNGRLFAGVEGYFSLAAETESGRLILTAEEEAV